MIKRRKIDKALGMEIVFDEEARKRYTVTRTWDPHKDRAVIIMYNPVQVIPKPFAVGSATAAMASFVLESVLVQKHLNTLHVV
ncbi:DUF1643 domain-containing protein (plasmid) [Alicyclobacillus fastidiosus]|uniref:DUF1643 domain-containing protein n=1 Tax=Alicyclobacillus fastidiosus TaxID=392011 RepID=A0ABY6ZPM9_9BACL|nr:hypothetical protein [Alicyclobacillus fastidiosus]WAH44815.1 DUF1643 domain-containing protein [Alicyclobacillus fastidiosus]GMA65776.1 hypothetical protein GCM10025859_62160 [Alicyclobacillus fastidiosus]